MLFVSSCPVTKMLITVHHWGCCPHFLFWEVSCLYSESEVLVDMTVIRVHRSVV